MVLNPLLLLVLLSAPTPPRDLQPWVDYAVAIEAAKDPACPPDGPCVQLQRVEVAGQVDEGRILVTYVGENLGRRPEPLTLLSSSSDLTISSIRWQRGRGTVRLDAAAKRWTAQFQPGAFIVVVEVLFDPAPSVPMRLPPNVAHVVAALTSGSLSFDESSDRHGGALFLQSSAVPTVRKKPVSIRVQRSLTYGSTVTFRYAFSFSGAHESTRLLLPLLGNESLETIAPELPYSVDGKTLAVTISPGIAQLTVTGHFSALPSLQKPAALPFEHWLFSADPRHPVLLTTTGVEVDPMGISATAGPRSRGFLLQERQSLTVNPIELSVERERRGIADATVVYRQSSPDHWVADLRLESKTAAQGDRVRIATPEPPHYAAVGGEAVRMFKDGGVLSVRAEAGSANTIPPISVQWRERLPTNPFLTMLRVSLPPQEVEFENHDVYLRLLPGYIPVMAPAALTSRGGLFDGLHIYAFLLAALALSLARVARFPHWAAVMVGILFAGLYMIDDFPLTQFIILLAATAVVARLPQKSLQALSQHRLILGTLRLFALGLMLLALAPAAGYVKDRLQSALHPWAKGLWVAEQPVMLPDDGVMFAQHEPDAIAPNVDNVAQPAASKNDAPNEQLAVKGIVADPGYSQGDIQATVGRIGISSYRRDLGRGKHIQQMKQTRERSVRPVQLQAAHLPRVEFSVSLGALLPGTGSSAAVLIVGPWLRGLWIFTEALALVLLSLLLWRRGRRLWTLAEEVGQ